MKISDLEKVKTLHGEIGATKQHIEKFKEALVNVGTEKCDINVGGWPCFIDTSSTFGKKAAKSVIESLISTHSSRLIDLEDVIKSYGVELS